MKIQHFALMLDNTKKTKKKYEKIFKMQSNFFSDFAYMV